MKFVLRLPIDPKTGKPVPVGWIGEGEPPAIVLPPSDKPADTGPPANRRPGVCPKCKKYNWDQSPKKKP
jgi:hypothetical protein